MISHRSPRASSCDLATLAACLGITLGCGQSKVASQASTAAPASGPATVEVVQVIERPLDTTLDMPGELNSYQVVAIFPRVTGSSPSSRRLNS
jgi:hypothetical protein